MKLPYRRPTENRTKLKDRYANNWQTIVVRTQRVYRVVLHRVVWVGITVIRHRILFAWGKHTKYIGVQDGIRAYRVEKNSKINKRICTLFRY